MLREFNYWESLPRELVASCRWDRIGTGEPYLAVGVGLPIKSIKDRLEPDTEIVCHTLWLEWYFCMSYWTYFAVGTIHSKRWSWSFLDLLTILYQFHAQKVLFKVPKKLQHKFLDWKWPPPPPPRLPPFPLEYFRKFIRIGTAKLPLVMNIISQLLTIGQKKQWKSFFKFCHISDLEQVV